MMKKPKRQSASLVLSLSKGVGTMLDAYDDEALEIAREIFTPEELEEILLEEHSLGVDISLDEILMESEDDEYSEWAE
jgi:hypothetical protein